MTNMELVLNMLAEVSTTEISQAQNPKGLEQHKKLPVPEVMLQRKLGKS